MAKKTDTLTGNICHNSRQMGEMVMFEWMMPTLSELLGGSEPIANRQNKAERSWCGAIAALNDLLDRDELSQGLILCSSPILTHPHPQITSWLFLPLQETHSLLFKLPPAPSQSGGLPLAPVGSSSIYGGAPLSSDESSCPLTAKTLLAPQDPLHYEQFAVVLTPSLSLVMAIAPQTTGELGFQFSFDPQDVERAWNALRSRVCLTGTPEDVQHLDNLYHQFPPVAPGYQTVTAFSRLMVQYLPEPSVAVSTADRSSEGVQKPTPPSPTTTASQPDLELLQAIAHGVKTPLATIRTYTRLLLKRSNLPPEVLKRLHTIDRECTEQIDRFNLIFRAVELETTPTKSQSTQLTTTSLAQVFQEGIPQWQKQAGRRNVTLDVVLPQHTPTVVSDPHLLDQVLTNVIQNFTSTLPTGSHVQVEVTPAGNQLKLQLISETPQACPSLSPFKALGQVLMFQPETGNLSLNLSVTKNLFEAIGGKLLIRQRPKQGEVMTIFLPIR
ncbi:HAMP domain-containing sensor histidine kinase [Roseofilum sp. Belize BBD 4]|uniref:sensor histidine kinase n=2 Tax=unclassified Roseofilum TaxID=2620099 RepID=UPI00298E61F3|nr:HAMP domain-containing sensor histidine kinase [Roseofilum sp. Belize BBD 4]